MPLIKSKSKQAFEHNLKAEMKAGKPQDQSLAIAYAMKKKAPKKMAQGGLIKEQNEKTEKLPMPELELEDRAEIAELPKAKPMLAAGGRVISPLAAPSMVKSSAFKARLLDKHGNPIEEIPPQDETEHIGFDDEHAEHSDMMAEGGEVEEPQDEHEEVDVTPALNEALEDKDKAEKSMPKLAEGGEVPMDEAELEHHASIAAAIMAKMKKMAEGGQVDLNENNKEEPNGYYEQNEDEALDWDMDDSQLDHQPEDSNEMADSREEDEENDHDESLVSKIMRKKAKKSAISA